jgi:hypothetical protein
VCGGVDWIKMGRVGLYALVNTMMNLLDIIIAGNF